MPDDSKCASEEPATKILIVGFGNPLRSDDAVGWIAADALYLSASSQNVEVFTRHQLTPELAEPVSKASIVIFIDAAQDGEPGELRCAPVTPQATGTGFSHELTPSRLLALSEFFYNSCPRGLLVSLVGENFEHGETLSPRVATVLPELIAMVEHLAEYLVYGKSAFDRADSSGQYSAASRQ